MLQPTRRASLSRTSSLQNVSRRVIQRTRSLYATTFRSDATEEDVESLTLKAIRRGTPETKVFGEDLEAIASRTVHGIPAPLYDGVRFLSKSLDMEGIYRIPGSKLMVDMYKAMYDSGETIVFPPHEDPCTVTSLITAFLRELPHTIFSASGLKELQALRGVPKQESIPKIKAVIAGLPLPYRRSVTELMWHFHYIHERKSVNKMSSMNIATCVFPSLAGPMNVMITHCEEIFDKPIHYLVEAENPFEVHVEQASPPPPSPEPVSVPIAPIKPPPQTQRPSFCTKLWAKLRRKRGTKSV